jgi:hypothetical protein
MMRQVFSLSRTATTATLHAMAAQPLARRPAQLLLRACSAPVAAVTRFLAGSAGSDDKAASSRSPLHPFLHPDLAAVFRHLPLSCGAREYLSVTAHNVLAEYRLALSESSGGARITFTFDDDNPRTCDVLAARAAPPEHAQQTEGACLALNELHQHVGVWRGKLAILQYNREKFEQQEFVHIVQGAAWTGRPLGEWTDEVFVDLGYVGDAVQEHSAALALACNADRKKSWETRSLLHTVADPQRRRLAAFRAPDAMARRRCVVPINDTQRSVLDGMRYELEAIQGAFGVACASFSTLLWARYGRRMAAHGIVWMCLRMRAGPPGTGKSTLIYHVRAYAHACTGINASLSTIVHFPPRPHTMRRMHVPFFPSDYRQLCADQHRDAGYVRAEQGRGCDRGKARQSGHAVLRARQRRAPGAGG